MNWYIHEKLGYSFLQVSHQRHLVQILQDHHGYPTTNTLAFKLLTGSSCKSLTGSPGKPICPTSPSTPLTQANKQLILFLPIPALSFLLPSSLLHLCLSHTCTYMCTYMYMCISINNPSLPYHQLVLMDLVHLDHPTTQETVSEGTAMCTHALCMDTVLC